MSNTNTRFHQSIAKEPFRLAVFREDEMLVKTFLVYACYKLDTDVFGFRRIDLKDFAQEMGYSTISHFQERVPDPIQLQGKSAEEIAAMRADPDVFIFETRFENMLYKLHDISVDLMHREDYDANTNRFTLRKERLLQEVHVYEDKHNRNRKYYDVKFTEYFLTSLSQRYLLLDKRAYSSLSLHTKKIRIQDLYLRLVEAKHSLRLKGINAYEENFDALCRCLGIDHYTTQKRKKQKLNECFDLIQTHSPELNFVVQWAANGKHLYKPIVCYGENVPLTKMQRKRLRMYIFNSLLRYTFLNAFVELHRQYYNQDGRYYFEQWMKNPVANVEEKRLAYREAHEMCFNKPVENTEAIDFYINYQRHLGIGPEET
ncbi:hypothetical protein SAMN05421823_11560 [Catalinimonas alkaloidigena]|uniref:Uncharacterized protein n=1 Tax=Catalinimonas alkaloidigena TaxID=1075417 RepID=A0A1G9U1X6_9BACT|nr:hypothetical protein [Catalinimonas alkaloidigena]SDM53908.1 hypothetical protein SAMN05421823_11560 [Catalinimonas alkaloidigena]